MEDKVKKPRFKPEQQAILDELLKMDKRDALRWALDCAEHVVPIFEQINPNDSRPRACITIGREWLNGTVPFKLVRATALAAHAAARATQDHAAIAVARVCGHAIATIHVQTHAIGVNTYGMKVFKNESQKREEFAWQIQHLENIKKGILNEN